MYSHPRHCDNATYTLNSVRLLDGGVLMSIIACDIVCPLNRELINLHVQLFVFSPYLESGNL